ncbi:NAD(P)-binding protein [Zopfia rhizophila CBS 207.26]|uniref:NAD(P)-binding protein n=1 Tax=Zopfia rhizophila CBS 207.26 TaxID=1314779 RepID=A0A6A6DCQ3_9PEZI|nr:NAD(P)-binding protein [Zopfia rhizophila CBS 207.26]
MSSFKFEPVLTPSSLIVVTGASGYIAAHVADQALAAGYRVRGTVRDPAKNKSMLGLFDQKYGSGKFQLVKVEDIVSDGMFDEAMKGASAFIHVASDVNVVPEPSPYIPNAVKSALSALKSAAKEPLMKRFVLTCSSMGCVPWKAGAWEGPFDMPNMWKVYAAAKVESEKAAWKWMQDNKPSFEFNTVQPAANFGKTIAGGWQSTGAWPKLAAEGDFLLIQYIPPQHFIDVVDCAKLHLGAAVHPEVKAERVFGFAEPYNWSQVLEILKSAYPEKKFADELPRSGKDLSHPPKERSEWLLKEMGQGGGYTGLKDSLKTAFADY